MSAMLNKASKYLNIIQTRGEDRKNLERVFRGIRQPEILMTAYMNLYLNKGAMTEGVNPEDTIDGISMDKLSEISESLLDGTFKWTPVRKGYMPKSNGKLHSLGIPGFRDKIVQEAMRLVLDAYYEPQFHPSSHGFRTGRGCYTALQEIKREWRGTIWFIEGDIKGCFENISHKALIEIISRRVNDNRFLKLLREMLDAGYMENWKFHRTYSGTPQGGIISSLLSNIFLNELDWFVENNLKPRWNRGDRRRKNPEYEKLEERLYTLRRRKSEPTETDLLELKETKQWMTEIPPKDMYDPSYRRLRYVRYADDFILGSVGTKAEAEAIRQELSGFLKEVLGLVFSEDKTLITHAKTERARFLGYEISILHENTKKSNRNGKRQFGINGTVRLHLPDDVIQTWKKRYFQNGKAIHLPQLTNLSDYEIVMTYDSEIRGIVNYYLLAQNVHRLHEVRRLAKQSLVKTLAAKHKLKATQVYHRYGGKKNGYEVIRATVPREGKKPQVVTFDGSPIRYKGSKYAARNDDILKD